jgi:hypothetical protein
MYKIRNSALCILASVVFTSGLVAFSAPSVTFAAPRIAAAPTPHAALAELATLAPHGAARVD